MCKQNAVHFGQLDKKLLNPKLDPEMLIEKSHYFLNNLRNPESILINRLPLDSYYSWL